LLQRKWFTAAQGREVPARETTGGFPLEMAGSAGGVGWIASRPVTFASGAGKLPEIDAIGFRGGQAPHA
jgi:hypothetical protein